VVGGESAVNFAFLGDIHANLPALEAVLADIQKRPVARVFHLGNIVGYGPQPRAVIHRLREERIPGVRGNHDERIATGIPLKVGQEHDDSLELAAAVCQWTRERLSVEDRSWLERLPFQRVIESDQTRIALFHASPVQLTLPPHSQQGEDFFREMAGYSRAHVNVFAHTHVPFWRVIDGCWFVNAGSVGFPRDGDPRATYATVEVNGGAAVRVHRVTYETGRTISAVRAAALPAGILRLLGTA
jgi:predicted phosphodiesterase